LLPLKIQTAQSGGVTWMAAMAAFTLMRSTYGANVSKNQQPVTLSLTCSGWPVAVQVTKNRHRGNCLCGHNAKISRCAYKGAAKTAELPAVGLILWLSRFIVDIS